MHLSMQQKRCRCDRILLITHHTRRRSTTSPSAAATCCGRSGAGAAVRSARITSEKALRDRAKFGLAMLCGARGYHASSSVFGKTIGLDERVAGILSASLACKAYPMAAMWL